MSVKKLLAYLIVLGVLLTVLLVLIFRGPTKNDILLEIQRANYCGSADDCAALSNTDALKCNAFVNTNDLDRIQELVDSYEGDPSEACEEPTRPSCVQFQCS